MTGLFIKDQSVNELAMKLAKISKAPSKTEAVRRAIQNELNRYANEQPLVERVAEIQASMRELIGENKPQHDHKKFMNEGWEL
ncbi:type II toxin-antitoxin system VapB family antitoxin [Brucella thiophenivorans]|uniref:Transcription factor family protein n=1 Tax=Brucella thiophenivorans TaxID=571255 RepID=A0A256FS98_9HYPH|nr:type II toxin-antitoxin system VapB family antitoxin [Brucella thiophenivorans]OYR17618.1 transcription factor family protein [Brucella thiophenivorans]